MRTIVARLAVGATVVLAAPVGVSAQQGGGSAVITGRVTTEDGTPLQGANVYITEMSISVGTAANGSYQITIPAARVNRQAAQLRVRSVGFAPQVRAITINPGAQTVNFQLRRDALRLSEVVVTGVSAATERIKVPFAVTRVDSTEMPVPGVNALTQLQGKVPGANIVAASGRPGVAPAVLLRGPKSLNASGRSQEPLYIVDGVILNGSIADINAQDIESVEVVKGAAAASLYGSQAANGVIQITTKRGRATQDGVRFGVRSEYGISDVEREIGIAQRHALQMDETQSRFCITTGVPAAQSRSCVRTIDWLAEALRINDNTQDFASGTVALPFEPGSGLQAVDARRMFQTTPWPGANYNAVQQLVQPKPLSINNVDMTGRFGATDVFANLNSTRQGGSIAYLEGYNRTSGRVNAGQQIGSTLQVNAQSFFSRSREDGFNQEGGGAAFFRLTRTPPIVDLTRTDSQGRLLIRPNIQNAGTQNENALYSLQNTDRIDETNRFIGALTARYTPASWINADATFGFDNRDRSGRQFTNRGFRTTLSSPATNNGSTFTYGQNDRSLNSAVGVTLPNVSPWASLVISPNVRTQYLQQDFEFRNLGGTQLVVSNVDDFRNATVPNANLQSQRTSVRQLTYGGGVRFDLKDRYILDANIRRDGNSTFGADNRWQTYGRVAGSWIVSNEGFMQGLSDKLDLLKLSANYGTSGLAPSFYAQYETYTIGTGGALTPATLGNRNLRPQVSAGSEFIVEVGAFRNWNLTTTYAREDVRDQIDIVNLPLAQRFQQQWQNIGTLRNETIEASLQFPVLKRGRLDWSGRVNFERTISTITKLDVPDYTRGGGLQATNDIFRVAPGERFSSFYGRAFATSCDQLPANARSSCGSANSQFQRNSDGFIVWTGGRPTSAGYTDNLWNTNLPGNSQFSPYPGINLAWGHPITLRDPATGAAQQVRLGQALPLQRWALSQNVRFGRFTAFGLLDAALGQSVWNQARQWAFLDFLSADQDQTGRPVEEVRPMSYYYRTQVESGLGAGGLYDILAPNNYFTEKASYAKLRELTVTYRVGRVAGVGDWTLGVTGRNLATFTNYRGFDPEVGVTGGNSGAFGSGALTAVDAFSFPNLRTFSVNVSTRF